MRLIKAIAAAAIFCFSAAPVLADSVLKEILDTGVLKVGTTGDWNPMTVKDPATNSYKGYDIDVMTELAKDMGVELEFVATDWKTLVNGVVGGNYHMTGSASVSPARMKAAGYSESYIAVQIQPYTTEVLSGRSDVFVTSNIEGATLTQKFEKIVPIPVEAARAPTPIAMLLPQGDQVWINYVNNWIKLKQARGFFTATAAKWGL